MTIAHHDFTITRTYAYTPDQVFDMFADPSKKSLWFGSNEEFTTDSESFDFRVGGREQSESTHVSGWKSSFDATYADIVPGKRIVYTYTMTFNGAPLSGSATSVLLEPVEGGTLLTFTEHGIHLDGEHGAGLREEGTNQILNDLEKALDSLA
jgi:uncharacterized protein YndB with AHSA1/START domain